MPTNIEWAIDIIESEHDPHLGPIDAPSLVYALNDAGLLTPDEDELIAEKQAHAELRKRIEDRIRELKQPLCSHMPEGDELDDYVEQWERQTHEAEVLTHILEATDD